jgi:hypothetical protein
MDAEQANREVAARIEAMRGMDSVDACRLRLLALRARIEINWPKSGGLLGRHKGLGKDGEATIADLLVALPSPLPVVHGYIPSELITEADTDLREVAGRAVDAALVLLEGASLDTPYPGEVRMLSSYRPGALEPIIVSQPTVGLLVATIIGTLDAISERIAAPSRPLTPRKPAGPEPQPEHPADQKGRGPKGKDKGGPVVRRP